MSYTRVSTTNRILRENFLLTNRCVPELRLTREFPRSGNEVRSLQVHNGEFDKGVTFSADLLLFRDDHGLERCECATVCTQLVGPALIQGHPGSLSRTYWVAVEL